MSAPHDSAPADKQPKAAAKEQKTSTREEVIAQLKAFGRGRKLPEGVTVRDLIAEGRAADFS